jgi:ketosteroid isomerase-like protein
MSTEQNRKTALAFINGMFTGAIDPSLCAEDVQWWVPGAGTMSKAEYSAVADNFRGKFKGPIALTVTGVTADGDRVAVEAESNAEARNGKIYNNTYHMLFLLRDGRVYLTKEYMDSAHAMEVLK